MTFRPSQRTLFMARRNWVPLALSDEYFWPPSVCSQNKGADQLCGHREADLHIVFAYVKCWFSHGAAELFISTHKQHLNASFASFKFI